MDGYEYEKTCAKRLRASGFINVRVTKSSGDQGIDIIAHRGGDKYGIQCKYYSSPVGNHSVQEAYAGAKFYDCNIAVVLTNTTFTPSAKELARKTGVQLWENGSIPFQKKGFRISKVIGVLSMLFGILGIITLTTSENVKYPILQIIEMVILIIAGLLGTFDGDNYAMSILSAIFYLLTMLFDGIFDIASHSFGQDLFIYLAFAIVEVLRSERLIYRTYGVHIWKMKLKSEPKEDEQVIFEKNITELPSGNNNQTFFQSKNIKNNNNEIQELQQQYSEVLRDYGNIYINFFKEEVNINSKLISANENNGEKEFVIECDNFNNIQTILSYESRLNVHLMQNHKMTYIGNNRILLIVSEKDNILDETIAEKERYNEKLKKVISIMAQIIYITYYQFGIDVELTDVQFTDKDLLIGLIPPKGTRVKTVKSYEKDISLKLGCDIKIDLVSEKGYIGVFVPIIKFKIRADQIIADERYADFFKGE